MDEVLDILLNIIRQTGENIDQFSDEELVEVTNFLNQTIGFLQEHQQAQAPIEAPVPEGADLLWILAGGQPEAFVNYLRTFPDPALNQLSGNAGQLANTIEQLSRTMPQGTQPSADGIEHAPINSSNIYGFKYDPKTGRLLVRFQSGSVYGYQGVPPGIFRVFQAGAIPAKTNGSNAFGKWWIGKMPSLGSAFFSLIRNGGYPYQRLS